MSSIRGNADSTRLTALERNSRRTPPASGRSSRSPAGNCTPYSGSLGSCVGSALLVTLALVLVTFALVTGVTPPSIESASAFTSAARALHQGPAKNPAPRRHCRRSARAQQPFLAARVRAGLRRRGSGQHARRYAESVRRGARALGRESAGDL